MQINTGKLASNSLNFLKQIKENDSNIKSKIERINGRENLSDFFKSEIFSSNETDQIFKTKVVNIQNQIRAYENELSKTQFIYQQLGEIEKYLSENSFEEAKKVIANSNFNKEPVLKEFFDSNKSIDKQLIEAKNNIENKLDSLEKEYMKISIATQNIYSIFSQSNLTEEVTKGLDLTDMVKHSKLDNRKVLNLISEI